MLLEVKT